ncbi:30S ribosomal protein S20 [Rubinisphaera margarita]|uniref:30S ribosomal protein S20 n=1 Tax=Rubinisphaera margarita TaxID=2909586 RepID=UPI001EE7BFB8|nr:30S ribosomal protein S20 [Rubinisphaera margarita]MCG6155068.1 30S ribosomal protein S20 [Rubinisphaera margarita]
MPNSPNAKKALRQSQKRRVHNRSQRSSLRTAIKKVRSLVAEGKLEDAQTAYRYAVKRLDQAAAKNMIHRNAAARTKSRLNKVLKDAATSTSTAS